MTGESRNDYVRKWNAAHPGRAAAYAKKYREAKKAMKLETKPSRPGRKKCYAEIIAWNRAHPLQEGWRR